METTLADTDATGSQAGIEIEIASLVLTPESAPRLVDAIMGVTHHYEMFGAGQLRLQDEIRAFRMPDGALELRFRLPEYGDNFTIEAPQWGMREHEARAAPALGEQAEKEVSEAFLAAFWPNRPATIAAWEQRRLAAVSQAASIVTILDFSDDGLAMAATMAEAMPTCRYDIARWLAGGTGLCAYVAGRSGTPMAMHLAEDEEDLMSRVLPGILRGPVGGLGHCFVYPATERMLEARILSGSERIQPSPSPGLDA